MGKLFPARSLELMVALGLLGIVMAIAVPSTSAINGQIRASRDVRTLGATLASVRAEAVRLHVPVQIQFDGQGYSWDFGVDGSVDGNARLSTGSSWANGTPSSFRFTGLGKLYGGGTRSLTVESGGVGAKVTVNRNGLVVM